MDTWGLLVAPQRAADRRCAVHRQPLLLLSRTTNSTLLGWASCVVQCQCCTMKAAWLLLLLPAMCRV